MAPSRGLEPRWFRVTTGCLPVRPRGCGSRCMDSNLRSSGCKPAALAAELIGSGAGGRFRAADGARLQRAALPLSYSSNSTAAQLRTWRAGDLPTSGEVRPDPASRTRSWRFCKPPPSHLARSGCVFDGWHQGKDLNPRPVVQSHVPYRLDHPGVDSWRPRRESNPPFTARQAGIPTRGRRGREKQKWWCAGEDLHLHSRWPRGYNPLGSLIARAGACFHHLRVVSWLAMPIRFSRCESGTSRGKKKRGLASPGPL